MPTVVFGRTHNPFNGDPELWVNEDGNEIATKVKDALVKAQANDECVEIECDGITLNKRPLKRTVSAAIKILLALYEKKKITAEQAVASVPREIFNKLLNSTVADVTGLDELGYGLAGAPGAAVGEVVTSAAKALEVAQAGRKPILLVSMTTPEDMSALEVCSAVVTITGGYTSHSAIVSRQMGKPCIVSYGGAQPDEGLMITVDGTIGKIYVGEAKIKTNVADVNTQSYLGLADKVARLKVYANADTEEHVLRAVEAGAYGVGLCRTEHTFFTDQGLPVIRELILAKNEAEKVKALQQLLEVQTTHFKKLFVALGARPAVIRLLDPPMHEFLPKIDDKDAISELAKTTKLSVKAIRERIQSLHEENPMMGHRGCRLSITFPSLARTQTKAIITAARMASRELKGNGSPNVGIMVPLIVSVSEMKHVLQEVNQGIEDGKNSVTVKGEQVYTVGAMLETPRACLLSYQLAEHCDFFSFGTNDLTQTTWALSRDDGAKFIPAYVTKNLLDRDPFQSLDTEGVGVLMAHAMESLKDRRKKTKVGICGEHGGDPDSIIFCDKLGLDYVSCSPPRIMEARLAAANCALEDQKIDPIDIEESIKLEQPITVVAEPIKPQGKTVFIQTNWVKFTDQDLSAKDFVEKFAPCKIKVKAGYACAGDELEILGYSLKQDKVNWLIVEAKGALSWLTNPEFVPGKVSLLHGKKIIDLNTVKKLWVPVDVIAEIQQQVTSTSWKPFTNLDAFTSGEESLNDWLLYAKPTAADEPEIATCLGMSKAIDSSVILLFASGAATQIDPSLCIAIAPPGSDKNEIIKLVKKEETNKPAKATKTEKEAVEEINKAVVIKSGDAVVVAPTIVIEQATTTETVEVAAPNGTAIASVLMSKAELEKLPYQDMIYQLNGHFVEFPQLPDWHRVIGYIPGQAKDKYVVVQTAHDIGGNSGGSMQQFIKFTYEGEVKKNSIWILPFKDITGIKE